MEKNRAVMIRLAIAGPDGSGKTTLCEALSDRIPGTKVQYAGKNRNHMLRSTSLGLKLWKMLRGMGGVSGVFGQYFLFYPLEYFENVVRFRVKGSGKAGIIYDRHPIDRMIMKQKLILKKEAGRIGGARFALEYPVCWFWEWIYRYLFPVIDSVYVLLPDAKLCFERSGGQYGDVEDARIRVEAYRRAIDEAGHGALFVAISVDIDRTVDDLCTEVVADMERKGLNVGR